MDFLTFNRRRSCIWYTDRIAEDQILHKKLKDILVENTDDSPTPIVNPD